MRPGSVIADRYSIVRLAGSGGMGSVFEGRDDVTGERVAIKVLRSDDADLVKRFLREARVLADLSHPNIVRYVSHGLSATGEPYLAMEWLVGEDLAHRLRRSGALSVAETVAVARMTASALAAAHRRGIIHRDVKPQNLYLVEGSELLVKLVDLGVAFMGETGLTRTGQLVGTPGYMAPEQARGSRDIDARTDLFSLGCVMWACLAHRPPFQGDNPQAALAKVLFEEPQRIRNLRPDVPRALDDLVTSMLAKDPERRPPDAAAVLEALGEAPTHPLASLPLPVAVGGAEQQYTCVLMTATARRPLPVDRRPQLTALAEAHGAHLEPLGDGGWVAVFSASMVPSDVATRAAHCALAARDLVDGTPLVIATGRALVAAGTPVGAVIDRATGLLTRAPAGAIHVDNVTAGLLDPRFEVRRQGAEYALLGDREGDGARRVLGKPTACVGRERELLTLRGLLDDCLGERRARVVLVTGHAGSGKSRLRQEHLAAIAGSGEDLDVWVGRGDPMRGGAPHAVLGDALRAPFGISGGEPLADRYEKIRDRVARTFRGEDLGRVADFLGEICATPFSDDDSVQLRAARLDPQLMADQVRRAFEDWLDAEVARKPLLIVLEDLHWGDWPSIKLVDAALRHSAERPLFVLALARPDVHELFTGLWSERGLEEIRLRELSRPACEKLVRQVLGPELPAPTVARLVARSQGNPFYLEELIRAVAEDPGAEFPETVLAMVQARFSRLPAEQRKALRAASVFGDVCWVDGVARLLGGDLSAPEVLAELTTREWLSERREPRFAGQRELAFSHALLREVAYGSFVDFDRALGHRLAVQWLDEVGEANPVTLAEHHQRAGDPERAIPEWLRAARQGLDGSDFDAALAHAERAVELGASGPALGAVRLVQAETHAWRGEQEPAERRASEALALLPHGGDLWAGAAHHAAWARRALGKHDALAALAAELPAVWAERRTAPVLIALCAVGANLLAGGRAADAASLRALVESAAGDWAEDPLVSAWVADLRLWSAAVAGDPGEMRARLRDSIEQRDAAGDRRNACVARTNVGCTCIELGAYDEAERELRAAAGDAARLAIPGTVDGIRQNLGWLLALRGRLHEGGGLLDETITSFRNRADARNEGASRVYRARAHLLAGELAAAAATAETAIALLGSLPSWHAYALAVQAAIFCKTGELDRARDAAGRARAILETVGALEEGDAFSRRACAEVAWESGDLERARAEIGAAAARLRARAERIGDEELRRSFLESVADHAATFERLRAWG